MKFLMVVTFAFVCYFKAFSQVSDTSTTKKNSGKSTVYFQLLGSSLLYSINYDRVFLEKENYRLSASLGYCFVPIKFIGIHIFTPQINYLRGTGKHNLHIGLGSWLYWQNPKDILYNPLLSTTLGYRYQNRTGGLFFQTGITIFSRVGDHIFEGLVPGIALGYTFK